tara:strand:+ start:37 stop:765 length:729 start_codon:yes stop_codon:yes gene_type:complete
MNNNDQMKKWIAISEQQQLEESFLGLFKTFAEPIRQLAYGIYSLIRAIIATVGGGSKVAGPMLEDLLTLIFEHYKSQSKEPETGMTAQPISSPPATKPEPISSPPATKPEPEERPIEPLRNRLLPYLRQKSIEFDDEMLEMTKQIDKLYARFFSDPLKKTVFNNFMNKDFPEMKDKLVRFLKMMVGPKLQGKDAPEPISSPPATKPEPGPISKALNMPPSSGGLGSVGRAIDNSLAKSVKNR